MRTPDSSSCRIKSQFTEKNRWENQCLVALLMASLQAILSLFPYCVPSTDQNLNTKITLSSFLPCNLHICQRVYFLSIFHSILQITSRNANKSFGFHLTLCSFSDWHKNSFPKRRFRQQTEENKSTRQYQKSSCTFSVWKSPFFLP